MGFMARWAVELICDCQHIRQLKPKFIVYLSSSEFCLPVYDSEVVMENFQDYLLAVIPPTFLDILLTLWVTKRR